MLIIVDHLFHIGQDEVLSPHEHLRDILRNPDIIQT